MSYCKKYSHPHESKINLQIKFCTYTLQHTWTLQSPNQKTSSIKIMDTFFSVSVRVFFSFVAQAYCVFDMLWVENVKMWCGYIQVGKTRWSYGKNFMSRKIWISAFLQSMWWGLFYAVRIVDCIYGCPLQLVNHSHLSSSA